MSIESSFDIRADHSRKRHGWAYETFFEGCTLIGSLRIYFKLLGIDCMGPYNLDIKVNGSLKPRGRHESAE